MLGVKARALDRKILVEIGFVMPIGLAAKNAILVMEFAPGRGVRAAGGGERSSRFG